MTTSAVLIGHDTLALHCGRMAVEAGVALSAVVTRHPGLRGWAAAAGLPVVEPGAGLAGRLEGLDFDWLLSVANLDLIAPEVLALPARGAVNFHDGPLPERAGLNAPVWALIEGAPEHGVTWHLIEGGVDEGPVLAARRFPVAEGETALSLNMRCFAAGIESFPEVLEQIAGSLRPQPQDLSRRRLHRAKDRPRAAAVLDLSRPAAELAALVRALDHGDYPNPLARPKLDLGSGFALVGAAEAVDGTGEPGAVLAAEGDELVVATGRGTLRLTGLDTPSGGRPAAGQLLPVPSAERVAALDAAIAATTPAEAHWRARLLDLRPAALPPLGGAPAGSVLERALPDGDAAAALAVLALGTGGDAVDLALGWPGATAGAQSAWVPLRAEGATLGELRASLAAGREAPGPMAADLPARLGGRAPATPQVGLSRGGHVPGTVLTLAAEPSGHRLSGDPGRLSTAAFALLADRLEHVMAQLAGRADAAPVAGISVVPAAELARTAAWNATDLAFDDRPIPVLVAEQAARTPNAPALTFQDRTLTYAEAEARAEALAGALRALGVRPGKRVGLHLGRSPDLVIGALAILKAGGAYVPLDPAYPADRIALYLEDSEAEVVLTDRALAATLPPHAAKVLLIDAPWPEGAPGAGPSSSDLAYLIYTSGSTGRPKGVMVTHRNVASFFAGMDARIGTDRPGTWLAVTSLSFDISVLELFWTLARGFEVVIQGDEERTLVAGVPEAPAARGPGMDFSLFYWGNDDGVGRDKYRLLLDGARFADQNGFAAIWTPERHFHAFGGPYPNPAVTGAAVAAVTRNLAVRAGSCVAPLHHPARIAEEWAVVDNLTEGRTGLAIASGWQPDDFVLRPENAVPRNKAAMIEAIDQVRRLWAGEEVEFPGPKGPQKVRTQPRPVSKSLPLWVTTAGNPETWREAGRLGANVLTHLLGQTVAEVGEKIGIYHAALREAGHDPAGFTVTLMLHTFLAKSREEAREVARGPMKAYLKSAAALIKQYAWAFPAFKKPQGAAQPLDLDLGSLSEEEMEAILDFAFQRYFEDSGLFGTVEDARARVAEVQAIGVGEVACLIDYGIPVDAVLDGLRPLAEVVTAFARPAAGPAPGDFSIAAQVARHGVTHLQCTPSMARMLVTNDDSRAALGRLSHVLVGGEALPGALAAELRATGARVTNMYGPTETTIWSTTAEVGGGEGPLGPVGLGRPIANTQVHVLGDAMTPLAAGEEGELWIGGAGVARGYWKRPDLTAERFVPDPFRRGGLLYRTGDLARRTAEGGLDFLGRADGQVKVHGHRIEAGEVEAALDALDGIRQSVVMAREDVPGNLLLVAYVTADAPVEEGALRAALGRRLPAHMVPARVVRLDAFPLTPNRKVDRKALPAPGSRAAPEAAAAPAAPARPEAPSEPLPGGRAGGPSLPRIAAIWSRLLGVEAIAPRDSFFDLGGHSILAVQAHRDVRAAFGAERLSITDVFRFPTLEALARRVDELTGADAGPTSAGPPVVTLPLAGAAPASPGSAGPEPADGRADAMARRRELRARRMGQA